MDHVMLGRTGLKVSVAGLGCGGKSRLGQAQGATKDDSIRVIREALELGVNYFDTAALYHTEEIVGSALKGHRDAAIISTKFDPRLDSSKDTALIDAKALRQAVEAALERLQTDRIDVFHLHAVHDANYDYIMSELFPELERLRDEGAIRFLAISEQFAHDFDHKMLKRAAAQTDCWDVLMVGFNILNPSARHIVLPAAIANNIGIEVMFAVRRIFSHPADLVVAVQKLVSDGLLDASTIDLDDPLGFLVHEGGATSIIDAAYRFARHEPGCSVVLTGTGSIDHLRANVASINRGPLPELDQVRLAELFGHLAEFAGN